jgi:hypothetical protein
VQKWLVDHPWITYILIYVFLVYIYNKVFRIRKLPLLKDAVIYLTIAVGAFILLLFQLDLELPIVVSLGVAVALMLIVRIRYWFTDRSKAKGGGNEQPAGNSDKPAAEEVEGERSGQSDRS